MPVPILSRVEEVERKREKTEVPVTSIIGFARHTRPCAVSPRHISTCACIYSVYPRFISDGIYEKPRLVVAAKDRNLVRGLDTPDELARTRRENEAFPSTGN